LEKQCAARGFGEQAIKAGRRLAGVKATRVGFGPDAKYMAALGPPEPGVNGVAK
jgi:hypothetical protein